MPMEADDEIDLASVSRLVSGNKLLIGSIGLLFAIGAGVLAFTTPPVFRAEVTIVAVRERDINGSGISGQLGALSSLVGVTLGQNGGSGPTADAVLDSRRLVEEYIKRNDLLPVLSPHASKPSTMWLQVKKFKEGSLTVRKDARKGVTTVAVDWTDPVLAARWANGLIALANDLIRTRALDDATRNIAYINKQLEQTNTVEMRQVLFDIIKNETKTLMLANGRTDYAFEVVDPAVTPERKIGPHRSIYIIVGFGLGAFAGLGHRVHPRAQGSGPIVPVVAVRSAPTAECPG
jgi:uncharacterized protein involved in exopolysaccharide biosynthesis